MAHAVEQRLRAGPRGPGRLPRMSELEVAGPEAVRPCLEALGWSLSQSLHRYLAWAAELAGAGAVATAGLTLVAGASATGGPAGRLPEPVTAVLWLAIAGWAVAALRQRDPLRLARSWGEVTSRLRGLARHHPLASVIGVLAIVLGTLDESSLAAPVVVQQLLQLVPLVVMVNVAGLLTGSLLPAGVHAGLAAAWRATAAGSTVPDARPRLADGADPGRRSAVADAVTAGSVGPAGLVLCAPAVAVLSPRGLGSASLMVAIAVVAVAILQGLLVHRHGPSAPSWALVMAAGGVMGAAASSGSSVVVAGCLLGAATGTGMEVGLRLARGQAVLWRCRGQLPLRPGDVVYRLDGREMEITLDSTGGVDPEPVPAADQGFLTDGGWRITQLSGSCWEGTKGRAQLLGSRQGDLLGVIRFLHPDAPGGAG